ncbi:hypothetical protein [Roseimaritima ulvae]|uniref:DUF4240 domain-containing protein n=1 Tax=Roseimaritima ulvae TaxID=980254 RepID=A0A5B9QT94_9BACT|nr:hypothetical protein [Roseimaritima ulvae]QEG41132.1 hypothetical protein UC8_31510 [Roseimaritima ulvae]
MSDEELFKKWFNAVATPEQIEDCCGDPEPWEEEYNQGLLMGLIPPNGKGLEKICEGHPHGEEILKRLQQVYAECVEPGDEMPSSFKERAVVPQSQQEVESLLLAHAAGLLAIAKAADSEDGLECVGDPPKLVRVAEEDDLETSDDDAFLNSEMFDGFEEKFSSDEQAPEDNTLILLTEPLYQWAWDDYAVPNYVLWPIYRGDSGLDEPRRPAYELFKRGVRHGYSEPRVIQYWFDSN